MSDTRVWRVWQAHVLKPHLVKSIKVSTHAQWLKFLNRIYRATPRGKTRHLVADNYAMHKLPSVQKWLRKHPRSIMRFTPASASWLSMVERFFHDITTERLRRGVFSSVSDSVTAIDGHIAQHNLENIWCSVASAVLDEQRDRFQDAVSLLCSIHFSGHQRRFHRIHIVHIDTHTNILAPVGAQVVDDIRSPRGERLDSFRMLARPVIDVVDRVCEYDSRHDVPSKVADLSNLVMFSRQTRQKKLPSVEWMPQKSQQLHAIQKLIEARSSHTTELPLRIIVDPDRSDCWARVLRFALVGRELQALNGESTRGMCFLRFER